MSHLVRMSICFPSETQMYVITGCCPRSYWEYHVLYGRGTTQKSQKDTNPCTYLIPRVSQEVLRTYIILILKMRPPRFKKNPNTASLDAKMSNCCSISERCSQLQWWIWAANHQGSPFMWHWKPLEESAKVGLKLNIQKTKIMVSSPITSWQMMGKQWKQWETLFWGAPKSLQMVTLAMKLKDACSLEEKLWPT